MSKQQTALRLALDALESGVDTQIGLVAWTEYDSCLISDAITAIKEALAQSEQDCVGWFGFDTGLRLWFEANRGDDDAIPLYKDPQQRTWVGLTVDEILFALESVDPETKRLPKGLADFAYAVQTKLKEKNT
jgi:hypothetical protein